MGGILLPSHGESHIANPAYLKIREDSPFVVPIPLGLFAFLGDLPEFDPDAKDFDAVELANFLLNPPFYLELRDLKRDDSTTIFIDIGENRLVADLDNLKDFMPRDAIDLGLFSLQQPRPGFTIRDIHVGFSPFLFVEERFELSERLERALAEAEPFLSDTDYPFESQATVNAGAAIHVGHAWEIQDRFSMEDGPRIFAGVNGKYIMGFFYGDIDIRSNLHTFDPIFDSENPPELTFDTLLDYARPESGDVGPKGHGIGFDLGVLFRYPKLDIGIGIQDVVTRINWRVTREEFIYNDAIDDLDRTVLFEDEHDWIDIPRSFLFTTAYRSSDDQSWSQGVNRGDYILATNLEISAGEVAFRFGGETYIEPGPIALRFGTYNQGKRIQFSFGAGIPLKFCTFDIAFATHSSTFQLKRGVTLATSLSFP
jgi:hypothetical protein